MNHSTIIGKFGDNTVSHNNNGDLIIFFVNGGEWLFSYRDIPRLISALQDFVSGVKGTKREFWRADGSGVIHLELESFLDNIYISEGNRKGHFWRSELLNLLERINLLLANPKFSQSEIKQNSPLEKMDLSISSSNEIFVVHGHNHGTLQTVARYIESLGCKSIILHEQPNLGRTIIEKFVENSKVGYAVVLLTADDRGGLVDLPFDQQKFRARQNVILELGFFMGKLGRERVCALCEENIEIPSDYSGVIYIAIDKLGAWKIQLAKELKHAGINIDTSKLLS